MIQGFELSTAIPAAGRVKVQVLEPVREIMGVVLPEEQRSHWGKVLAISDPGAEFGVGDAVLLPNLSGHKFRDEQRREIMVFWIAEIPIYIKAE